MSGLRGAVVATRSAVRGGVEALARMIGGAQVGRTLSRAGSTDLVVLDIDNTLANSWPSFLEQWPSERARLASLPVIAGVKALAHDAPVAAGHSVVFISHRNLWHWPVTYRWLRRNGFAASWSNVVLVPTPADKVRHLRRCCAGRSVTYWDDLTHNHESGTVEYYEDVIGEVGRLGLDYRGYADILAAT